MARSVAVLLVAVLVLPLPAFAATMEDGVREPLRAIRLEGPGTYSTSGCDGALRLDIPAAGPDKFIIIGLEGIVGEVRSATGDALGTLATGASNYVLLRTSESARTLLVECAQGTEGLVKLVERDVPIVEAEHLPAHVVAVTFTRSGLRHLGFENFVDLRVPVPHAGPVRVDVTVQGGVSPTTLQAFAERPQATAEAWAPVAERVLAGESDSGGFWVDLATLALACSLEGASGRFDRWHPFQCSADAILDVLDRYEIPEAYARDLAERLATDSRCEPGPALSTGNYPCLDLVSEWIDEVNRAEGLPSWTGSRDNLLRGLGVRQLALTNGWQPTDGPCGDSTLSPWRGWEQFAGNRTRLSRQLECLNLAFGALLPVRYSYAEGSTFVAMGSLAYGSSTIELPQRGPSESSLVLATQGPAIVEVTFRAELGSLVDLEQAITGIADEVSPVSLPMSPEFPVDPPLEPLDVDTGLRLAAWTSAEAAYVSDEVRRALEETPCVGVDLTRLQTVACGSSPTGGDALLPLDVVRDGMVNVASGPPAALLPATPPATLPAGPGAASLLLASLGVPLAPATDAYECPLPFWNACAGSERLVPVFVPYRLDVRYGALHASEEYAFLASRVDDAATVLGSTASANQVPIEVVAEGVTFLVVWTPGAAPETYAGSVTVASRIAPSYRVVNLREGVETADLDLDGILNVQEGRPDNTIPPRPPLDPLNPDSDFDGLPDGWEDLYCEKALFTQITCDAGPSPQIRDAALDPDGDLLSTGDEYARTLPRHVDSPCFERLRWRCLTTVLAATGVGRLATPCGPPEGLIPFRLDGRDLDSDCDLGGTRVGFHDGWEFLAGADPFDAHDPAPDADVDADGLTTREEFAAYEKVFLHYNLTRAPGRAAADAHSAAFVHPAKRDTDGDVLPDVYEVVRGVTPFADPVFRQDRDDGSRHADADGLDTLTEYRWSLSRLANETPGLTLGEYDRRLATWGLDPLAGDTDGDGSGDRLERDRFDAYRRTGTPAAWACYDPLFFDDDCDEDGLTNALEVWIRYDGQLIGGEAPEGITASAYAATGASYPCVLRPGEMADRARMDREAADSDADGVPDWYECWFGLDPTRDDAARDVEPDGLTNREEFAATADLHPGVAPASFSPARDGYASVLLPVALPGRTAKLAEDADGDGMWDSYERALGLDPLVDNRGLDSDRDGLEDTYEHTLPLPGRPAPAAALAADVLAALRDDELAESVRRYRLSPVAWDSDGDGIPDGWEHRRGLDPASGHDAGLDPDGDGLSSLREYAWSAARFAVEIARDGARFLHANGLAPDVPDRDGDDMLDGFEVRWRDAQGCPPRAASTEAWPACFDPLAGADRDVDFDGDGLTNVEEALGWDVEVLQFAPGDARTLAPIVSRRHVDANPLARDTSGGGIPDGEKSPRAVAAGCPPRGLDPWSIDTDGDLVTDHVEVWQWTAVQGLPQDIDGDCYPNAADWDSDGDTFGWGTTAIVDLSDGAEIALKVSEPTRHDTDGDGYADGREIHRWRAAGVNPVDTGDPRVDVDGDGLLPIRDADSDGDGMPDSFEFRTGLEPWVPQGPTHDTDGDLLYDLCEYRVTAGLSQRACAGHENDPEPDALPPPGDALDAGVAATTRDVEGPFCVDPAYPDCDADGIEDYFELEHSTVSTSPQRIVHAGCSPGWFTNHAPPSGPTECMLRYLDWLAENREPGASAAMAALVADEARKPLVTNVRATFAVPFDSDRVACFYHRACSATATLAPSEIRLLFTVEDESCRLDGVRVFIDNTLVRAGPMTYTSYPVHEPLTMPIPGHPSERTFSVTEAERQGCTGTFPFAITLNRGNPSFPIAPHDFYRITIVAWTLDGRAAGNFRQTIAARGFNPLDAMNDALTDGWRSSLEASGRSMLDRTRDHYLAYLADAKNPRSIVGSSLVEARVASEAYLADVGWFDSEYDQALRECGMDPAGTSPDAALACPGVLTKVRDALGHRARAAALLGLAGDYARPAAEGLARATELLLRSGADQRALAETFGATMGPAFGFEGGKEFRAEHLEFWEWLAPTILRDASSGPECSAVASLVGGAKSVVNGGAVPDVGITIAAARRFDSITAGMTGASAPIDPACLDRVLGAYAGDAGVRSALDAAVAAGITLFGVLQAARGIQRLVRHAENVFVNHVVSPSLAIDLATLAWSSIERTSANALAWTTGCVILEAASVAVAVAAVPTGGTALAVWLFFKAVKFLGCAAEYVRATGGYGPAPLDALQSHREARGHNWRYRVDTYPMTKLTPGDAWAPLARVVLADVRVNDVLSCGDGRDMYPERVAYVVRVERHANGAWREESTVRYAETKVDGAWVATADRSGPNGFLWLVADAGEGVELVYLGFPENAEWVPAPGLVRVTVQSLIDHRVVTVGGGPATFTLGDYHMPTGPLVLAGTLPRPVPGTYRLPAAGGYVPPARAPWQAALDLGGVNADCSTPPVAEARLLRGVGAPDGALAAAATATARIEDVTGEAAVTRTFRATGSAPGMLYYWDFGDEGSGARAALTRSPDEIVAHEFPVGTHEVTLSVVDPETGRLAGTARLGGVVAAPAVNHGWIAASRDGRTVTITGDVRNRDVDVAYTITEGATTRVASPPARDHDVRFTIDGVTGGTGRTLRLNLVGGTAPRGEVQRLTYYGQVSSGSGGAWSGRFHASYPETDRFTHQQSAAAERLTFEVVGPPGAWFVATGPAGQSAWEFLAQGRATLTIESRAASVVGAWSLALSSNGNPGDYAIRTVDRASSETGPGAGPSPPPQCPNGCPGGGRDLLVEHFESRPTLATADYGGRGAWHVSGLTSFAGSYSAYMGYEPEGRYGEYSLDFLHMSATPAESDFRRPMRLEYWELSSVNLADPLRRQHVSVLCSGHDASGRFVHASALEEDVGTSTGRWMGRSAAFDCGAVLPHAASGFGVTVTFAFASGYRDYTDANGGYGWFIDDVAIRAS